MSSLDSSRRTNHQGTQCRASDADTEPFLFIIGRGRSGTTLLAAMFDSHPAMAIPLESHFVATFGRRRGHYGRRGGFDIDRLAHDLDNHWGFRRWGWQPGDAGKVLATAKPTTYADAVRFLFAAFATRAGKSRYGEKTPINVLHVEYLADLFPESRFIHIVRDGRDVTVSYLDSAFGPSNVAESAWYWRKHVERGREAGQKLGSSRYREIHYETLVEAPEDSLRELCAFVDLTFVPAMLEYHLRSEGLAKRESEVVAHQNLARPITTGLRDWRRDMTRRDIATFEFLAGETLQAFGYERALGGTSLRSNALTGAEWSNLQAKRCARRLVKVLPSAPRY